MNSNINGGPVNTPATSLYPSTFITRRSGVRLASDWQPPAAIWKRPAGKQQPHTRIENAFWADGTAAKLKPIPAAVYLYLRSLADEHAQCWPSPRRIARHIGASESSVKRALRLLAACGLVAVGQCYHDGTDENATNLYTLLPLASFRDPHQSGPTSGHADPTQAPEVGSQRPPNKKQCVLEQEPSNKPPAVVAAVDDSQSLAQCEQLDAQQGKLQAQVLAVGVAPEVARKLIEKHGPEKVQLQLACLPDRRSNDPAALLVASLKSDYAPPRAYMARVEAQRAQEQARKAQAQQEAEKAQQRQQQAHSAQYQAQEEARLDEAWKALDPAQRAEIEQQAREQLGVLARRPSAEGALQAARRRILAARMEQATKSPDLQN